MGAKQSACETKVVIIGGGVAGMAIANAVMKAGAKPTVIDARDRFWHAVGSPRAVAQAGWANRLAIPYTKVLDGVKGAFQHGIVTGVDPTAKTVTVKSVTDETTTTVSYDYLVLATGSSQGLPVHATGHNTQETLQSLSELQGAVAAANNVVIVGGGPVGVEIAGEVKAAFPAKSVTLVHSGERLAHSKNNGALPEKFSGMLKEKLEKAGVSVVLGARVEKGAEAPEGTVAKAGSWVGAHTLTTSTGASLPSDVTIFVTGGRPNTSWLASTPLASALTEAGYIKVTDTLAVEGQDCIFACGDAVATAEPKMAFIASMKHAPVVSANLKKLVKAASKPGSPAPVLKKHKVVTSPLMFVTVGPKAGAGVFGSHYFGNKMVSMAKGGDLFAGKTAKDMGFAKGAAF